ncbi:MAG: hypothetical protein ACPGYP_04525 [Solirubrobacterales bacterium]
MLSLRRDDGWVLMDAVMSAVVVVLAFTATFYALDASSKTASRDVKRTTALVVAQNELDKMRNDLTQDISVLDVLENSSSNVTYQGTNYAVTRRAYYVTGLGGDQTTACGKKFDGTAGGTAKFIYLKVSVAHNGSTSTADSNPGATLDAYYAPEGGSTQTGTATLRIYVLDRNGIEVNPGTQQVQLYLDGVYQDQQIANENGCVLFIGLERGSYEVRIPNTKYEIHMERKPTNAAIVNVPINVPQRAALSKDVRIETPVTVTPAFRVNNGSADITVNPSNASTHVGPWVATSEKITRESGTDFTTLPGSVHMPHAAPLPANQIYPDPGGYGAYAGACDINDPDDGNVGNGSERATYPLPGTEGTWAPGGTYTSGSPLWLSQIRARAYANSGENGSGSRNESIVANSVQMAVKLVADPGAEKVGARCGSRISSHYNRFVRLPGVTSHNGYLSDEAESLPVGRYDVCARVDLYYEYRVFFWWTSRTETRYMSISNQDLFYRSAISPTFNFSSFDSSSTGDCANGEVSWS